ncbi:hypothetical protein GUJ93_ZPchr0006g41684 [Zizania palustris]|uniref:Uncharacterized protein n=1 Tax=Zizania palustris TaxID=103762 RepID=A0A8J5T8R7_ZIZPA|nr:hypothetical protein GUJ93_ZPchr0006g41684 [Zizania palustris]
MYLSDFSPLPAGNVVTVISPLLRYSGAEADRVMGKEKESLKFAISTSRWGRPTALKRSRPGGGPEGRTVAGGEEARQTSAGRGAAEPSVEEARRSPAWRRSGGARRGGERRSPVGRGAVEPGGEEARRSPASWVAEEAASVGRGVGRGRGWRQVVRRRGDFYMGGKRTTKS